jgi:hypothetical protein
MSANPVEESAEYLQEWRMRVMRLQPFLFLLRLLTQISSGTVVPFYLVR